MGFAEELLVRAKKLNKKVVLPETEDERTLQAAARLTKEQICRVVLVGVPDQVRADAKKWGADVSQCEILSPLDERISGPLAEKLYQYRKEKGLTQDQARQLIKDYLYFGTLLLKEGQVDGYVAGATHTTGDNLRPALQIIKATPGLKTVSRPDVRPFEPGKRWRGRHSMPLHRRSPAYPPARSAFPAAGEARNSVGVMKRQPWSRRKRTAFRKSSKRPSSHWLGWPWRAM